MGEVGEIGEVGEVGADDLEIAWAARVYAMSGVLRDTAISSA